MQITVELTNEQLAVVDAAVLRTGKSRSHVVGRAIEHMAILEKVSPEEYAGIAAGLKDFDEGRIATKEDVEAVFRKHGAF